MPWNWLMDRIRAFNDFMYWLVYGFLTTAVIRLVLYAMSFAFTGALGYPLTKGLNTNTNPTAAALILQVLRTLLMFFRDTIPWVCGE